MENNPYVIKRTKAPLKLILILSLGGALLLGGILFAIWYSAAQLADARMAGTVTAKKFTPAPEQQIILGKDMLTARDKDGEYELTVDVRGRDGVVKSYIVTLGKAQYETLKVGDSFDVGPYLERN